MESLEALQEQVKALQMENALLSIKKEVPSMLPIFKRVTELCFAQTSRKLTDNENRDMSESLQAYENYADKILYLDNLFTAGYIVGDFAWMHEICARVEEVEQNS
jgi:hypothetical protein